MPPPQPDHGEANIDDTSLSLDHSHILLTSFNSFLTVAIHNILYYRNIYPPETFLSTKAYNLPVHQNRHPKVCAWIRDAVDAVAVQLSAGHVSRIAITPSHPPARDTSKAMRDFARVLTRDARSEAARERHLAPDPRNPSFRWPDLDEQLRGALRRMASAAEGMAPLPVEGCGFTVAVEMDDEGRAPIGSW
ncbi:hypothetical protein NEMBOFW57_006826 [Staphylotrichum longicolle]|uniref:HORMA domain-containing protein n=1 Tax=Staphylotrichum longicolle TaxID=669026 RepID=A0AAD4EX92_9PEZI|nr:hypothetical protein NEMBOFW57_006826 [Staphylotrichum longicolle]